MTTYGAFQPRTAQSELSELRSYLIHIKAWPEAGDQFVSLISQSLWDRGGVEDKYFDWIPKVVQDAHKGMDIGLQYPSFFHKLLTNRDLRNAFIKKLKTYNSQ